MSQINLITKKGEKMKKLIIKLLSGCFLIFNFASCGIKGFSRFGLTAKGSTKAPVYTDDLYLYLEESGEFKSIPDLNQEAQALNFLDKLVLLDPNFFLEEKDYLIPTPLLKEEEIKEEEILFSAETFCSNSLQNLQEDSESHRYSKKLFARSKPSHVNIISLIPQELLSNRTYQNIYCTFLFKVKGEKTHLLINQEINTSTPSNEYYQVSLLDSRNQFDSIQTRDVLKARDLESIIIDKTDEFSKYELFCDGLFMYSLESSDTHAFKKISQNLPASGADKIQTCVFFGMDNNNNPKAISSYFRIDFSTISAPKEKVILAEIGEPFISHDIRGFAKKSFLAEIVFDDVEENKDYSHIDVIVDSKCVDDSFRGVSTKITRLPLSKRIPLMSVLPEELFFILSMSESSLSIRSRQLEEEYRIDLEEELESGELHSDIEYRSGRSNSVEVGDSSISTQDISDRGLKAISDHMYRIEYEKRLENKQKRLDTYRSAFQCIYTLMLEDKIKDRQKVFENGEINLKLKKEADQKLKGYKMSYHRSENQNDNDNLVFNFSSFNDWLSAFETSSLDDVDNIKRRIYNRHLDRLSDDIDDMGNFKTESLHKTDIDSIKLKCHTENIEDQELSYNRLIKFHFVERVWQDNISTQTYSVRSLLTDEEFNEKLEETKEDRRDIHMAVCRLFLYDDYEQESLIKYFSPEMRFLY